ncbi:helix-turn-helix domain-containing protein [Streptomyces sp. CS62]|uniref:helix-turn-helix domain-containing protein n=1 Tax=Streptomyces sp. CS62 TaxID=3119268 RepID=UPI002F9379AA
MNGTRLASTNTLCALVAAWDARGRTAIGEWLVARNAVEDQLIELRSSSGATQPVRTTKSTGRVGETEEAAIFAMALTKARNGWVLTDLAGVIGVDPDVLIDYLSGRFLPTPAVLGRVLDAFSVESPERERLVALHRAAWTASHWKSLRE